MKKPIIYLIFALILVYLIFSFVLADMNPYHWDSEQRGIMIMIGLLFGVMLNYRDI